MFGVMRCSLVTRMMELTMQMFCCFDKIVDSPKYSLSVFPGMTLEVPSLDQMPKLMIDIFMNLKGSCMDAVGRFLYMLPIPVIGLSLARPGESGHNHEGMNIPILDHNHLQE